MREYLEKERLLRGSPREYPGCLKYPLKDGVELKKLIHLCEDEGHTYTLESEVGGILLVRWE